MAYNLCLELNSKKNSIKETIHYEKIDLICMHETEIIKNLDHDLFSFPGYSIETENNSTCSRVAIYMMSFPNLHEMAGRATPDKMIDYKLALQLFRVVNYHIPTPDWINVNLNNIQTTRQTKFVT